MTRTQNRTANAVSLFPFLAVLVCAMGALIFLLIIITRRVRSDVVSHAREIQTVPLEVKESPNPEKLPEIVTVFPPQPEPPARILPEPKPPVQEQPFRKIPPAKVDPDVALRLKIASLTSDRNKRKKTLTNEQLALANARKRLNETESELARINRQWLDTEEQRRDNNSQTISAMEKRRQLTKQLQITRQQIKQVRRHNAEAASRYAFMTFDGVSGTTRRPILIECSGLGLQFLPEGVLLTLDDLEGSTLEVNPLLAGAHSLAEYFFKKDSPDQTEEQASQPYVLLLVRPSGSVSYYAARKLLSNLGRPFGYELIEEDWELHLPDVDPEAQRICRAAVEEAETKSKTIAKPIVIGRGTGPAGRRIRFHKETGSFEVVDSDSSYLSGNAPLSKNRNSADKGRSSTGTSQRAPAFPRRKVLLNTGASSDRFGETSAFNRNRKRAGNAPSGSGSGTRTGKRRRGTGSVLNKDDVPRSRTGTGAESALRTGNLPGNKSDAQFAGGRFVIRNTGDGKTGSEAKFASGSENDTAATGRFGFRNDFPEQNRFPKPLSQTLQNGGLSRKDPLRYERLFEWTDTGIEQGGGRMTRQKWDPRSRGRNATDTESKTVIGKQRATGSSRGVLADSKPDSLETSPVLPPTGNSGSLNKFSGRDSSAESKTAAGNKSQRTTSDGVTVSLNGSGSRLRQRTADHTSRSSSSRGPTGSRPLFANQAGAVSATGSLQRTRGKRTRSKKTTLRRRRWGKSGPGAGIGFEREVLIQIDANRLMVGRDYRIDFDSLDRNNPELLEQVLYGIEREANAWGMPPSSFYWVPKIRFQVGSGGSNTAQQLKNSLKQAGLFSKVEYVQDLSRLP